MIERYTSKKYLELSCIELLSSQSLEKLTVKEICKNCNLSTRTFYKYYKDKYDIANNCFTSQVSEYLKTGHSRTLHDLIFFTLNIICDHPTFFSNVFKYTGQNNIRVSLVEPLRDQYFYVITHHYHTDISESLYNAITFFIHGQLSYVEEVIRSSSIPEAKYSTQFFENAIPACLKPFLVPFSND